MVLGLCVTLSRGEIVSLGANVSILGPILKGFRCDHRDKGGAGPTDS